MRDEKEHGQIASGVESYVKDHPESSIEYGLNNINDILDHSFKELNWEFLNHEVVPPCCKKFTVGLAIAMQFFFKYKHGFSTYNKEIKDQIWKVLIEQVPFRVYLFTTQDGYLYQLFPLRVFFYNWFHLIQGFYKMLWWLLVKISVWNFTLWRTRWPHFIR